MSKDHSDIPWTPLHTVNNDCVRSKEKIKLNRTSKWKYGYNSEHGIVVISKTGQIGDIYNINGVNIALPKAPVKLKTGENKWVAEPMDKDLKRIKTIFEWKSYAPEFREKHVEYIEQEFDRRKEGKWFMNNGQPTYITGHHYMYLQHTKIDIGHPDFREANRILFLYWEACKADERCYGMTYLKIRRSGFSFMASSVSVDTATLARDSRIGILSKSAADAKKMFTDKVVPISHNYPFFFSPVQSGMDRPKTELLYSLPAQKITKKNMHITDRDEEIEGLDTSIDWKATDDNSYDGEKLLLLVGDEVGKWLKPNNIKNNWRVTKTCLRLGKNIVGKAMHGSTCNALAKGGQNFKDLYMSSNPNERSKNSQTKSGMYSLFIPMEWNMEGFIDEYGHPVFYNPKKPVKGIDGRLIDQGAINYWDNEVEALKDDPDALNEFYRQYPRTESHAFRDESKESLYNLTKIYQQIDYNDGLLAERVITRGNFHWEKGIKDSKVIWSPDPSGRFTTSWVPPAHLQNNVVMRNNRMCPGNEAMGAFGCDSYDISGVVGGGGSKGALHGLTKYSVTDGVPSNKFFLQYIARPLTAEIFFEEVLMAIVFYGMPILAENNKARLLYHLKNRGYRGFSMDRPDRDKSKLSVTEKELGGMPNSSEDVKQTHADCIGSWIEEYVGYDSSGDYRPIDEIGDMPFTETLNDWAKFDINNRTKHDASISSGLAIMATRRHRYTPIKKNTEISFNFVSFDNSGNQSQIKK